MKSIWNGTIGFGLVQIPVKLYNATRQSDLELVMLDKADKNQIRFQRVNAVTGQEVPWKNIVKGYQLDDRYIVLEDEDFEKASPQQHKQIQLTGFTDLVDIDPRYYENPYYLQPEAAGVRAYTLLREALAQTGKAGIASFMLRNKESLAILYPKDDALVLNRIRYQQEVLATEELELPLQRENTREEMEMAVRLISQFSQPFDISRYKDRYRASLLKLIRAKAAGNEPRQPRMKLVRPETGDLVAQLKASLESKKKAS